MSFCFLCDFVFVVVAWVLVVGDVRGDRGDVCDNCESGVGDTWDSVGD